MIKLVFLINRIPDLSQEAFVQYHLGSHAPLFTSIPEARYVRRYAVSHPVPGYDYPAPAYDGLTEIWFDSWVDHDAFFTSANFLEKVKPDENNLFDPTSVRVMVTEEHVVIDG